jgi:hypothetical protein
MRHFPHAGPVTTLPLRVGVTAAQAGLIAAAGSPQGQVAGFFGATRGAVPVSAITVAADEHGAAATGAQVASSGKVHGQ